MPDIQKEPLGTCTTQANPGVPHTKCYECIGWTPCESEAAAPAKQNENYFCGREYCTGDHIDAGRYCHGNPEAATPAQPVPPDWIKAAAREIWPDNNNAFSAIGDGPSAEVAAINERQWQKIEGIISRHARASSPAETIIMHSVAPGILEDANGTRYIAEDSTSAYCKACALEAKDGIELGDFCHNCKAPAVAGRTQGDEQKLLEFGCAYFDCISPKYLNDLRSPAKEEWEALKAGWKGRAALRESVREAPSDIHRACENAVREYFGYKKEVVLSAPGATRMVEIFERHWRSASPEVPAAPLGVCQNQIALHFQAASCVNWRPWMPSRKDSVCEAPAATKEK